MYLPKSSRLRRSRGSGRKHRSGSSFFSRRSNLTGHLRRPTAGPRGALSNFMIQKSFGRKSGHAQIFVAKSFFPNDKKAYAIKVVNINQSDLAIDQVLQERKLLSLLQHEFIINLNFTFFDGCRCFFVLDLAPKGDLRGQINLRLGKKRSNSPRMLRRESSMQRLGSAFFRTRQTPGGERGNTKQGPNLIHTEKQVAFFVRCVIESLSHIHERLIIHRDVKPENLLLDANGYVLLSDFGVSHQLESVDEWCYKSSGTRSYMAPEILNYSTNGRHTFGVDLFSLGILVYELLCGRKPLKMRRFEKPWKIKKEVIDETVMRRLKGLEGLGVSQGCRDTIYKLLLFDPSVRMDLQSLIECEWLDVLPAEEVHAFKSKQLDQEMLPELLTQELELTRGVRKQVQELAKKEIVDEKHRVMFDDFYYEREV